jgi:PEP-CTERM motif
VDLSTGSDTFSIEITRRFNSDLTLTPEEYVTNISLTSPVAAPVPEPSSAILLSIVLLAVALVVRKRIAHGF